MQGLQSDDRVPGLDLLRAFAIVWVMLFHSFLVGGLGDDFSWLSRFGWAGVDIFFVLSGYLIGGQLLTPLAHGEALRFGCFYARRAWRILPAFGVVLALYVTFPGLREVPQLADWWRFATFTLNLSYDYTHYAAFSHAWSLCVEEHFYLLFPLIAWWFARRPSAARVLCACLATVALGIVLRWTAWMHDVALAPPRNWYIEDIYYPTWMRLDGLLCGVMLAALRVYRTELWLRLQQRALYVVSAGFVLIILALWLFRDRTGLLPNTIGWPLLSFGIGGVVFGAADRGNLLARLRLPGAAWIATISYSLYLSHKLAFHVVSVWIVPSLTEARALQLAAYAVVVLLFGAALHYTIERPFLKLRKRRLEDARAIPAFAEVTIRSAA